MLDLKLPKRLRVLCLGAHSDDIEIGCGGTILTLAKASEHFEVFWRVFSAEGERAMEARKSANAFLRQAAKKDIEIKDFRGSFFPQQSTEIKEYFESLKSIGPDLVFTHYREDRHQDHRVLSDLTWNTFRDHLILEYEIPKYDGDLGIPNTFVSVSKRHVDSKISKLMSFFESQRERHWFSPETFAGLMRLRGMESASPSGYAEAFYGRKISVGAIRTS